ncbi:MAG: hypothetical protein EB084_20420 [Proteobacteria bacterium]|nr:hypothetical protein [Pseudomonadota bacterium]
MSAETYATLLEAAREVATAKAEAKLQTERANDARQAQAHQLAASGSYGGIVGEVARNVAPHVAPTLDGAFGYLLPLLGIGAGAYVGFRLSGWAGGSKADQVGAACVCALLVGVASLRVSAARNLPVRSLAV